MNIQELYNHNLKDAARFKATLNPTIWDRHEHLTNAVRDAIMIGVDEYCSYLGLSESQIRDVVVAGQNAGYDYKLNAGVDVVVIAELNPDPTFREFFNENKYRYSGQHQVPVTGEYINFYVQPAEQKLVSRGAYSVLKESWVQVPVRRNTEADDTVRLLRESYQAAQPKPVNVVKQKRIVENKKPTVYGFGEDYIKEDAGLTPDGVSASTKMFLSEEPKSPEEILSDFIEFCSRTLELENKPDFKVKRDPEWSKRNKTFGRFNQMTGKLEVSIANRHIMDVLRTVAHELVHQRQAEIEPMPAGAGETGSDHENEANALAGVLMREYGQQNPELFTGEEELAEGASGYIPTKRQAKDPRYEMALTVDIKPGTLGKVANAFKLNTDSQGVPQIANPNGTVKRMK